MSKPALLLDIKSESVGKQDAFDSVLPSRNVVNWADQPLTMQQVESVEYAVVWEPQPGMLAGLPNLKVIFSLGAGVDHVFNDPKLPDLPIVRFVDPDLTGRMVEWVVLQTLMHVRQQRPYDALQRKREWKELSHPAASDFRIGIMGFGELGQASTRSLLPLGFKINAWSRSVKNMDGVTSYHGAEQLDPFLAETDILIGLLPYTSDTHGIFNRALFENLSRSGPFKAPVFINAGRGGSQIETDIIDCLRDGTLHSTSLDVFEREPLAPESPLWSFNNAIITPHMAAVSDPMALARHVADQIERYEAGDNLQFLVDKNRGY